MCSTPNLIILLVGSCIRNGAGYVWAYNSKQFFQNVRNQSDDQQAEFMSWIPLIGGSLGAMFGGFIYDRIVSKSKKRWHRLLVLIFSNLLAAPFAFAALLIPAPYCYFMLIFSNIIGECWVGICLALIIELVPDRMKTTALSVYFFVIGLGGFLPALVTPVSNLVNSYQASLIILFPGFYVLSAIIFFIALLTIQRDESRKKNNVQYLKMERSTN